MLRRSAASWRVWWIVLVACAWAAPSLAAPILPGLSSIKENGNGEVTIDAEHIEYDQRANVITATGAVKITRGDMVLTADKVKVNRATQVADCTGNVVVVDPQGTLTADVLTLDLLQETGSMDEGSVYLNANHYRLTGAHFEKHVGQSYAITDGKFTTCVCHDGEPPSWSIRGQHVTLDLNGYGRVNRGTLDVRNVPVFYIPYGVFPIQRERQSGFLFPRFGYSNRRGFQTELPFYLDINKSQDATISVDVETAARIGVLGEYRYAFSPLTLGEFSGTYFNEQIRGASSSDVVNRNIANPNIPINRWSVGLTHDQWLPYGFKGFADVLRVSDDLFLREINVFTFNPGVDVAIRTRRFERSRVGIEKLFDDGLVIASATWYQDFINPDKYVFQAPPRIEAQTQTRLFDDHVLAHFAGEAVNYQRDSGYDGNRFDLHPELEVPWHVGTYGYGSVSGGFRETAYHLDNTSVPTQVNTNPADPGSQPPSILPALDKNANRELFYMHGEAGTSLSRVYPFEHFGFTRLKHTIEPSLEYLYVPQSSQRQAALPIFDAVDRVNQRSVLTYGITSRLIGRTIGTAVVADEAAKHPHTPSVFGGVGANADRRALDPDTEEGSVATGLEAVPSAPASGPIRELARFSIFQSYDFLNKSGDFIDEVNPVTGQVEPGKESHASDLSMHLRLTPYPYVSLDGRTDYSVTGGGAKSASVSLFLTDPRNPADDFSLQALRGRTRIGIGYRFVSNQAVEEVNGSMFVRILKQLYGAYESRFDAQSGRFLEHRYGLRFVSSQECWVVDLGVSDRVNPQETEVRLLISLVGLAQFGKEPFRQSLGAVAPPTHGFLQ